MHDHFANNSLLVDDNAASHMSNIIHEYLTGKDIMHIDQPLYSPYMNTIEHMWNALGHGLEGVHAQSQTPQKLVHILSNLRDAIPN